MSTDKGLVMINTGHGKGKSTAAFGQALRAAGHDLKVCIIQFIKGLDTTGEAKAISRAFPGLIELHVTGTGFTWQQEPETVRAAALSGWRLAGEKINSGRFGLVILDELTYLISLGIIAEAEVIAMLSNRPAGVHVLITGRDAGENLMEYADLVTEMRLIKHPLQKGIKASRGIEF